MNSLKLKFTPKEYPYRDNSVEENLNWGEIDLFITDDSGFKKVIFAGEWNIFPLLKWISDKYDFIRSDMMPKEVTYKNSIAKSLSQFYLQSDNYSDESLENIHDYRYNHNLANAMPGSKLKSVYIGKVNSQIEISSDRENEVWAFVIDFDKFEKDVSNLKNTLQKPN